jgi:uncharacterized protein VirK/YbjX
MTCFQSWLDSVQPSEARDWLADPKEDLLRHLDSLTWGVLAIYLDTNQTPDDLAEALRENLPMWEETASEEEIDAEEKNPLTQGETDQLREIANEAHSQP